MTLSHDEFRERMIDYLYGELTGDELRAFEAHLAASEDDRRELAAMQATLRIARQGLAEATDEAPPAHVQKAVLAAAQAQLRAAVPARADEARSLWSWLRSAWLMPSLAVVAAVTFVVLGKNPEAARVPMEATAKGAQATPASSPSATPPTAALNAAPPAAASSDEPAQERESEQPAEPAVKTSRPARDERREGGFAVPPPAWDAKRATTADTERAQDEAPAPKASAAARPRKAEAASSEDKAEGALDEASPRRASAARAEPSDDLLQGLAAPSAPAASAAQPSATADSANDARGSGAVTPRPRAPDDLVRRATDHFAARRWQQAAAAYRELLRRFPNDARAVTWKKQLSLATQAQADADIAH